MTSSSQIYCLLRQVWVKAFPEELIRQQLIKEMLGPLGYPAGHLAIEKSIGQMPHLALSNLSIPDRRMDLVCFAKGIHPDHALYPLIVVECKAVKLTDAVLRQVAGYNQFIKAFFVALANGEEVKTGWYDRKEGDYRFVNGLPDYHSLLKIAAQK